MSKYIMSKYTAECFRQAKKHLWDGDPRSYTNGVHSSYICFAVDFTNMPLFVKQEARDIIRSRLQGYSTLRNWLVSKGIDVSVTPLLQKHRHDWLDLLIKEFES
jgi:hypothetical protein